MKDKELFCAFCGKPKEKTKELVAGPNGICICEECVEICREQIMEARARMKKPGELKLLKPAEIKARARRLHHRAGKGEKGFIRCGFTTTINA